MHVVANLAEATRIALERWAPHSAVYHGNPTIADLRHLLPAVTGGIGGAYPDPWRDEDYPNLQLGSPSRLTSPAPARSVRSSAG